MNGAVASILFSFKAAITLCSSDLTLSRKSRRLIRRLHQIKSHFPYIVPSPRRFFLGPFGAHGFQSFFLPIPHYILQCKIKMG